MKSRFVLPLLFCCIATARAATLSVGDAVSSPNGALVNIDSYGGLDWALWKKAGATDITYNVPTNSKASATAISDFYLVGATTTPGYRASTSSPPTWDFSYTAGTAPTSGTLTDVNGIFHPDVATAGRGIGLTVTLPTTDLYRITLFVSGYDTTSTLTATLPGLAPVNNLSFTPGLPVGGVKQTGYFTVDAGADIAGQALTLEFVNTSANTSSHVAIAAVAVQIIPEPSVFLSTVLFSAVGLFRRRRP